MDPSQGPPPGWIRPEQMPQHDPWLDFHWGDLQHHWSSHSGGVWEQMALAWRRVWATVQGLRWRQERREGRKG